MTVIPQYGAEPVGNSLMNALLRQSTVNNAANLQARTALLDAQTSDMDRRAEGLTTILQNAPDLASVFGSQAFMGALQNGYDPTMGLRMSPEAAAYSTSYATEADRHRLTDQYATGFEKLAGGAADFVSNAGMLPDMTQAWQRTPTDFTRVARDSEIGASAARAIAEAATVKSELYNVIDSDGNILFQSPDWNVAMNTINTNPEWFNMYRNGGVGIVTNGWMRDNQTAPIGTPIPESVPSASAPPYNPDEVLRGLNGGR